MMKRKGTWEEAQLQCSMKLKHGKGIIWNSEKANDKSVNPPFKWLKKQDKDEKIFFRLFSKINNMSLSLVTQMRTNDWTLQRNE